MFRTAASLVLLIFVTSCALFSPPPPDTVEPPESFYELLERDLDRVKSYAAKGRVSLKGPARSIKGRLFLAAKYPHSIRLEVTSLMGSTVWAVALNGREVFAFDGASSVFYKGGSTPKNIARLLGLPPLGPDDIYTLTAGRVVPKKVRLERAGQGRFFLEDRYIITFEGGLLKELKPVRGDGYLLEFHGSITAGGVVFPKRLEVAHKNGTRLEITYDEVTLNPRVDDTIFTLEPPPGSRLHDLGR